MDRRFFLSSALALPVASALASNASVSKAHASTNGFRLLVGGDTDFAESYRFNDNGKRTNAVEKYGYNHSLAMLAPLLRRADYTVLNLETVLTDRRTFEGPDKEYRHWSRPDRAGRQLSRHGIDAVSLANNHAMDFGVDGLKDTLEALTGRNIKSFGAGMDQEQAAAPHLIEIPNPGGAIRRAAFVGLFEYRRNYDRRHKFYATAQRGGTNRLDLERFAEQVRLLKQNDPTLFVIAYPHWGGNYSWRTQAQAEAGRAMIDAGADMVIGHHGHCMQEVERYADRWILYGIGNFMFNTPGGFQRFPDILPYGLAVELLFDQETASRPSLQLYPILSDNRRTRYQPILASADDCQTAYRALVERGDNETRIRMSIGADTLGNFIRLES